MVTAQHNSPHVDEHTKKLLKKVIHLDWLDIVYPTSYPEFFAKLTGSFCLNVSQRIEIIPYILSSFCWWIKQIPKCRAYKRKYGYNKFNPFFVGTAVAPKPLLNFLEQITLHGEIYTSRLVPLPADYVYEEFPEVYEAQLLKLQNVIGGLDHMSFLMLLLWIEQRIVRVHGHFVTVKRVNFKDRVWYQISALDDEVKIFPNNMISRWGKNLMIDAQTGYVWLGKLNLKHGRVDELIELTVGEFVPIIIGMKRKYAFNQKLKLNGQEVDLDSVPEYLKNAVMELTAELYRLGTLPE